MRFSISVKGIEKLKAFLAKIPHGAKGIVAMAVGVFLLGDERHGLRHYAPWKKVTRKSVYGSSFFSHAQQKAFFAGLKSGKIGVPYHRTGAQGNAWHIAGGSTNIRLVNTDPSVRFTRGQTLLHAKMGWQTVMETVKSNWKGAMLAGKQALMRWIGGL